MAFDTGTQDEGNRDASEVGLDVGRAFTEHFDYICRLLRRLGARPADVEDLAQDVVVIMCRRWSDYRPIRPLRSWLAGIAVNVMHKYRDRSRRGAPVGDLDIADRTPAPDERIDAERARSLVLRALAVLPPRDRAVLVLHDIEEISMRDIAAALSIPLFTAYTRLRRARVRFTKVLEDIDPLRAGEQQRARVSAAALLVFEREASATTAAGQQRARELLRRRPPELAAGPPRASLPGVVAAASIAVAAGLAMFGLARLQPDPPPAQAARHTGRPLATAGLRAIAMAPAARLTSARTLPALRPAPPAPVTHGPPLARGLTGYWRFDEGRGSTTARDHSPGQRDCRLRSIDPQRAWVDSPLAGGVKVSRGWIECPQPPVKVRVGSEISLAAWVRPLATPYTQAIANRQLGVGPEDHFFLGTFGRRLRVRSSLWGLVVADRDIPDQRWVHVAFTHAADGSTRLYQDGVEVGRSGPAEDTGCEALLTTPMTIGSGINGPGESRRAHQFWGGIDELALYDRALSPGEVASLAAGEQPLASR